MRSVVQLHSEQQVQLLRERHADPEIQRSPVRQVPRSVVVEDHRHQADAADHQTQQHQADHSHQADHRGAPSQVRLRGQPPPPAQP